jgi:hypothetical protein
MEMSIRDEIDRVIEEEAKRKEKDSRRSDIVSKRKVRIQARQPPTYLAVLIGKILYKFYRKKPEPRRKPVTPGRGIEGYVDGDFYEKPKITTWTIFKEDLRNLPKKIMRGGRRKRAAEKKLPTNSKDTFDDWKDYFE